MILCVCLNPAVDGATDEALACALLPSIAVEAIR